MHLKRALRIPPVYDLADDFLRHQYKDLSRALSALREREALAEIAEERVAYLPDVPYEYCAAAVSLGDCMQQLYADAEYTGSDRRQLMDSYAHRALALLATANDRFDGIAASASIADAYLTLGDVLVETRRPDDARQVWESAETLYTKVRAAVAPDDRNELDVPIAAARERLASLADQELAPDGDPAATTPSAQKPEE